MGRSVSVSAGNGNYLLETPSALASMIGSRKGSPSGVESGSEFRPRWLVN